MNDEMAVLMSNDSVSNTVALQAWEHCSIHCFSHVVLMADMHVNLQLQDGKGLVASASYIGYHYHAMW